MLQLINAYRFRGHRQADLDPLRQYERPEVAELDPAFHGLTDEDLDTTFNTGSLFGPAKATLREILDIARATYCRTVGAEYMHINDTHQKRWIQQRLEAGRGQPGLSPAKRHRVLERLVAATTLEQFLHRKYVGQKRFSLEGGESTIPLLDDLVQGAGRLGVQEVVIGMAHRGRINVLVNTVGKHPAELFDEFEGKGKDGSAPATSSTTSAIPRTSPRRAARSISPCPSTPRTSRSSTRWCRARCGPAKSAATTRPATRCCPSSCTETRPSPAKGWSWRP